MLTENKLYLEQVTEYMYINVCVCFFLLSVMGCYSLECKQEIDQNHVTISTIEVKEEIVILFLPPGSCLKGVPNGETQLSTAAH